MTEFKADAQPGQLLRQVAAHFGVDGVQHLRRTLDDGDFQPAMTEVFSHFQPDVSGSGDQGAARPGVNPGDHLVHIRDGPEAEHPAGIGSRQFLPDGAGTGGQQQLVVMLHISFPVAADGDGVRFRVDGDGFAAGADVDAEPFREHVRRNDQQAFPFGNDAAGMIRQPAVGVRNILPALKQDDLCRLVKPSQPCRRAGSAGHAAHNENFLAHENTFSNLLMNYQSWDKKPHDKFTLPADFVP
ncbi:hypothetical protein SDC9_169433 [bioreactor metagenome]|uniref:Uncharacterized protein n=1 Tax=bioreactor metagenome TaxID=1076179 RepID=A0A645G7T8_9ZZZZ